MLLSPDGQWIVSASGDRTLKLWDPEGGRELSTLVGHSGSINDCVFSPDARWVVSASDDETVRLWDVKNGTTQCEFQLEGAGSTLAWAKTRMLVVGTKLGSVELVAPRNLLLGPPVVTAWGLDDGPRHIAGRSRLRWVLSGLRGVEATVHLGCPFCRQWVEGPCSALGSEVSCPHCGRRLKLNPFTINADWRPIAAAWKATANDE